MGRLLQKASNDDSDLTVGFYFWESRGSTAFSVLILRNLRAPTVIYDDDISFPIDDETNIYIPSFYLLIFFNVVRQEGDANPYGWS